MHLIVSRNIRQSDFKTGSSLRGAWMSSYALEVVHAKINQNETIFRELLTLSVCVCVCLAPSFFFFLFFSCLIFWPLSAICASATFGTSPPTRTCAKPGKPNPTKTRCLGAVQLTRLSNCTLTLIFKACEFLFCS